MSAAISKFAPAGSYLKLIGEFPLRPLRNEREYKAARAVMERLAVRGEDGLDEGERDYLDGLDEFISNYDQDALTDRPRRGTPHQRLRSLLEDSSTSPEDLEKILRCSRSLVSLMLSGKRELSKDNIRALARHFKLSADYFL
ncbi:MAG TPA: helix-turn-helix domain-containing protein [Humisphaera sp.]|nr:helix-turn-helix domain-containing protein [Humisphaera sp.]